MKRFWALLAALVMLWGCAQAQEVASAPIASYPLPRGAEALHLWDSGVWEVPALPRQAWQVSTVRI